VVASWRRPSTRCRLPVASHGSAADRIGVGRIADAGRHLSDRAAAIAEIDHDRVGGLAWHDPGRAAHAPIRDRDLDRVAVGQLQALGHFRADCDHVVPGELAERLWQLLQPCHVGEATVPHARVRPKHHVDRACVTRSQRRQIGRMRCRGNRLRRRAGDETVMQGLAPALLEFAAEARHPGFPHRRVRRRIDPAAQHLQDLMRAAAAIKRRDQRLDQRHHSVDRAPIAPAFECMGERQVPTANLCGLVGMQPGMDAHPHPRQQFGKVKIAGRGIDRIAVQNQERIDSASRHVPCKIGE